MSKQDMGYSPDSIVKLVISKGVFKGKEFIIEEGENLIGRWDAEDGVFPEIDLEDEDTDAKISRRHAIIDFNNGDLSIRDIGSLNGTFVNRGAKLEIGEAKQLADGDEIIVGKLFLKVLIET